ncbi:MAG: carbonic anhydrase [Nocardioides sp.]|jgi:carbonic anhydrase
MTAPHSGTSGGEEPFADLLSANAAFAASFTDRDFDGVARAGVAIVTCMDSRIRPLTMLGLSHGDAKIFRNPGGRVTDAALEALVLGVHLLGVTRILIVPHTRCAMALHTEQALQEKIGALTGQDVSWHAFHVVSDQEQMLRSDVRRVAAHPLVPNTIAIGGFIYDVDTGALNRIV